MQVNELVEYTAQFLNTRLYRDYCPNGLQVAGRPEVRRVVAGVSANRRLIEAAIEQGADAIVVHHGFFWKSEDPCLTGWKRERIHLLLAHDLNLFAYHLPLDAHPEVGNNAQLAARLGFTFEHAAGEQNLLCVGRSASATVGELAARIELQLARAPLVIGAPERPLRRVAWCTGGAQGFFNEAIQQGVDAFVTGEVSEQMVDMAQESGVAFFSAGHYSTERFGVQALAEHWATRFNMEWSFVDTGNPV